MRQQTTNALPTDVAACREVYLTPTEQSRSRAPPHITDSPALFLSPRPTPSERSADTLYFFRSVEGSRVREYSDSQCGLSGLSARGPLECVE